MAARDGYLTPAEVAARGRVSVKTVYRAINAGRLLAFQPTARYLIDPAECERWLRSQRHDADAKSVTLLEAKPGSREELLRIEREAA